MAIKKISESFTEDEFKRLKKVKGNKSWHDFIMELAQRGEKR